MALLAAAGVRYGEEHTVVLHTESKLIVGLSHIFADRIDATTSNVNFRGEGIRYAKVTQETYNITR